MALGLVAGAWQWGRYDARADAAAAQEAAEGKPVAELEELVSVDTGGPEDAQWRTATVTGLLDPDSVVELRGRTVNRTASLQYLAWMRTEAGRAVLVNLGWQPRTAAATDPSLPAGEVTVTGVVRSFEADNGKPGTRINPAQMPSVDQPVVPAYVMATSVCTASDCVEELEPVPIPSLSLGPHLSYALQWWLLTAVAAPLGVWLTRRDALHERERAQEGGDDAATPRRKRSPKRRPTDEEIEDAL
nr:SURF1 family protein [Demequina sp. TTPB684]